MIIDKAEYAKRMYESGVIDKQVAKEQGYDPDIDEFLDEDERPNTLHGNPVEKNGERLAFLSNKSNTIHIVQREGSGPRLQSASYSWSACNLGGRKSSHLYIDPSEVGDDYITRNGEVVGKLCGNCSKGFEP